MCLWPFIASGQQRTVVRNWMFGAGAANVHDSYLSPLDYQGPSLSLTMTNERKARWGCERVSSLALVDVNATYGDSPSKNAHFYDAQLIAAMGWHYNWYPVQHLRLRLGGLGELSGGGTYNTRNGNNPAQGRAAFDIAVSGIVDYTFRSPLRSQKSLWHARLEADAPLAGIMFSPQYGQSYFELFSMGHYDHNVCPTWVGNAPSARLLATLHIPVRQAHLIVGYRGDARQSCVNHLSRHAWSNGIVLGFTRNLSF